MNFILISYLYDKQYVPFQAATTISIFYCIIIFPLSIFINIRIDKKKFLYSNRFEMILGYIVAIIALILIIMRAFNLNWGIIPITIYSHQVVFIGIILSLIGVFLKIEYTIGLLFCQKTIDAVVTKPEIAQIISLIIWIMIVALIVFIQLNYHQGRGCNA